MTSQQLEKMIYGMEQRYNTACAYNGIDYIWKVKRIDALYDCLERLKSAYRKSLNLALHQLN